MGQLWDGPINIWAMLVGQDTIVGSCWPGLRWPGRHVWPPLPLTNTNFLLNGDLFWVQLASLLIGTRSPATEIPMGTLNQDQTMSVSPPRSSKRVRVEYTFDRRRTAREKFNDHRSTHQRVVILRHVWEEKSCSSRSQKQGEFVG